MNELDVERIARLASRLELAPRELLALAARVADQPTLDGPVLERELAAIRGGRDAAAEAAGILLLGPGAYAPAEVADALALAWSDVAARGL